MTSNENWEPDDGDIWDENTIDFSYWHMANGEEIKIEDMSINHIKNALNLLLNNGSDTGFFNVGYIRVFRKELVSRGIL